MLRKDYPYHIKAGAVFVVGVLFSDYSDVFDENPW